MCYTKMNVCPLCQDISAPNPQEILRRGYKCTGRYIPWYTNEVCATCSESEAKKESTVKKESTTSIPPGDSTRNASHDPLDEPYVGRFADLHRRYKNMPKAHPEFLALRLEGLFEHDAWAYWRSNPPGQNGFVREDKNWRLETAISLSPQWPLPLPYENWLKYFYRQRRAGNEDVQILTERYKWRRANDPVFEPENAVEFMNNVGSIIPAIGSANGRNGPIAGLSSKETTLAATGDYNLRGNAKHQNEFFNMLDPLLAPTGKPPAAAIPPPPGIPPMDLPERRLMTMQSEPSACVLPNQPKEHLYSEQLRALGWIEPKDWALWRTNNFATGKKQLCKALQQAPDWPLPLPHEDVHHFVKRRRRWSRKEDEDALRARWAWNQLYDPQLRNHPGN